jgi:hypothetical protein
MPKRPADDANIENAIQATGIKDDDWMQKLLEVGTTYPNRKPDRQQKQYSNSVHSNTELSMN